LSDWQLLLSYVIYVDAQVNKDLRQQQVAGLPRRFFARPMTLQVKQEITIDEVKDELSLLVTASSSSSFHGLSYQIYSNQAAYSNVALFIFLRF